MKRVRGRALRAMSRSYRNVGTAAAQSILELPGAEGAVELRACLAAAGEAGEAGAVKALLAWGEGAQPPPQLDFK